MNHEKFNRQAKEPNFQTLDGPTVITKRNFGLLRGKTIHEAPKVLLKAPQSQNGHDRCNTDLHVSPPPTPDSGCWSPCSSSEHIGGTGERRGSVSIGNASLCDRSTALWDWPLGEPKVVNGEKCIQAELSIFPFTAKEVSATVMGNELIVHCKSENVRAPWNGQREIFRSYTLPLNVNPRTAEFSITQGRYLKIVVKKEMPLKLAIAFYGPDSDEGEETEDDHAMHSHSSCLRRV